MPRTESRRFATRAAVPVSRLLGTEDLPELQKYRTVAAIASAEEALAIGGLSATRFDGKAGRDLGGWFVMANRIDWVPAVAVVGLRGCS